MHLCEKCNSAMVNASIYDPDGLTPLIGGEKVYKGEKWTEWWVCINRGCEDGQQNTAHIKG